MRTKDNWIDALKDYFANGDCPQEMKGKYHPEILAFHLGVAIDYLVVKVLYPEASKFENWGMLDVYAKPYKIDIQYDEDRDEKFLVLPVQPINLPANRGVRIVSTMKDQKNYRFIYRDNNTSNVYGNTDVDEVITIPRYYVEGDKLFFSRHIPYDLEKLLVKLIVPFDALDYDDNVNVPQGFGKLAFDLVVQSLSGRKLEKVSNDNNANTP